ncbi:death-associated protein kinase dapk-1-like isoform X2 [Oscarella lobularis]|uniref:death-associated protein kinase dapk-1-like isoform X2 n=1 Tax=Oscarella lobularis TaxID=121494 RepID=UPI0033143B7F
MNSSTISAIERILALVDAANIDELRRFLATQKGFRPLRKDFRKSAIHYVSEKRFETEKEADEWLRYLVVEKNQSVDLKEVFDERRPLHYACAEGNIFGVKWLISHGADVNVRDVAKHTPYLYACASSIDAMEKMLVLEENNIDLSSFSICWAAEARFSSYEQAHEIFGHLIEKKGMSIDARTIYVGGARTDMMGDTALHCACELGSIFGVKWLLEHCPSLLDSVNDGGCTPFMLACRSPYDRSLKVRYLSEKGANCLARDYLGRVALFDAVQEGIRTFSQAVYNKRSCLLDALQEGRQALYESLNTREGPTWYEDAVRDFVTSDDEDVNDVIQYLVVEKQIDVNSVDREKRTPVLHACYCRSSIVVIQLLMELGANILGRDSNGQNALHLTVSSSNIDSSKIVDFLLENGVDVTCKDKYGKLPYQVASNGEVRMFLRRKYDTIQFSVFRREKVRPDSIKICVVGSEMAGKTTLVNSLLQLNCPPIDPKNRTAGVDIRSGEIPGVGKGSIWDFGAQSTFHSAHGLFFQQSNTIFVLVLRFVDGQKITSKVVLLEIGRYWCAFVKAPLRLLSSQPLRLVLVFNLIGCEEATGVEVRFQCKQVVDVLQEEFHGVFTITHVIEMDCNKSDSIRMNDFRGKLKKIREIMLKAADDVPMLCRAIEQNLCLPDDRRERRLRYFMSPDEFQEWVSEDVGILLTDAEKNVSVEYLDSSGIIVNLVRQICLRPSWLCRNVIGPLLAPPYFPISMPSGKFGEVSLKDVESALRAFENDLKQKGIPCLSSVAAKKAIEVLRSLDLCIPVEDARETYQIPALLQNSIRSDAWIEESVFDVYRGQRYECAHSVDIISPSSFVVFQSRCARIAKTSREAWKDGVKLVKIVADKVVECLVELGIKKEHCCIDIILRWSSQTARCHEVAKEFLAELKDMIVCVCDERSPGVVLNWYYLDSKHLRQLDEDPATYSMSDVETRVTEKALNDVLFSVRPDKRFYSSVRNLAVMEQSPEKDTSAVVERTTTPSAKSTFPADEESITVNLMRACAALKGSKWEEIGGFLITLDNLDEIRRSYAHSGNVVRMLKVLDLWNTAKSPTVGQLLMLFEEVGVNRCHIRRKYEELGTVL